MIKSPILYLVGLLLILNMSACQQTPPIKSKSGSGSRGKSTIPTPTNRPCFSTAPTKPRTKSTVFMLAAGADTVDLTETSTDINNFSQTVQQHFKIPNTQICKLTNAFKAELENALHSLKQHLINNDLVIIYFSGHGSHVADDNGDERDGWDEALVTYDIEGKTNPKATDVLRDDHFTMLVNALPTDKVLTVMDTCFSSGMYLKKSSSNSLLAKARSKFLVKGEIGTQAPRLQTNSAIKNENGNFDPLKGLLLAAAAENEKALEIPNQGGLFTLRFVQQLKKLGDIKPAFEQAAQQVKEETQSGKFKQTPQDIGKWEVLEVN